MTEGGNGGLTIAGEMQGEQDPAFSSCTLENVSPLHI